MGMMNDDTLTGLYALREFLKYSEFEGLEEQTKAQIQIVTDAINTMHKYQQLEDFARWVATEVIDEEMWTYNHLSFTELACRKLVQLGIMQESDGEYTYEVVEDGNDHI